ncbi:MAG: hypothetical protein ACJAVK_001532 [Akkermansiaceae bacterium]|jgi:hypothetical protein
MTLKKFFLRALLLGIILFLVFVAWLLYFFNFVVTGPRFGTPFAEAHQRAVTTFVDGKGFGIHRFRKVEYFHERSFQIAGEVWNFDGFDGLYLIGASQEYGERYFESGHSGPPLKSTLGEAVHRPLEEEEAEAIKSLRKLKNDFVILKEDRKAPNSRQFTMQIVAPILAEVSCLKCHEAQEGDLLGAFEYHLTRANQEKQDGSD